MKNDGEKPRPELIPLGFVIEMGLVMAYGARKYALDNWMHCDDIRRYYGAALRHVYAVIDGEELDPETGRSHLAHAACSCAMAFGLLSIQKLRAPKRAVAAEASVPVPVLGTRICLCEKPEFINGQCAICGNGLDPLQLDEKSVPT